jgi:small neutral amino acid transporter SnatA (MarC family)
MGSNPIQSLYMYTVCVYSLCVVLCVGRSLVMVLSRVQGVLLTVYRVKKLKKAAKVQQKGM